jgi:hypothetical protein
MVAARSEARVRWWHALRPGTKQRCAHGRDQGRQAAAAPTTGDGGTTCLGNRRARECGVENC